MLDLARRLAEITPPGLNNFFFCAGGSEAVESAIKTCRQYFLEKGKATKYKMIGRWLSFHGNTIAAQSVGGLPGRRNRHTPLLLNMGHIPPANCYHCFYDDTYPDCGVKCASALEQEIIFQDPDSVAAFIVEPVVGAASGVTVPPPEYFKTIREICLKYDVLLVVDEVFCGMGRTGHYFAIEHWDTIPDILIMAKGIGGGYASLGAIAVSDTMFEAFQRGSGRFEHNFTMSGNPLSCAVGSKVLEIFEREKIVARARRIGRGFLQRLDELERLPLVGEVRGMGLFAGIELVSSKDHRSPFPRWANVAQRINDIAMSEGLIIYPGSGSRDGVSGDHILLAPPLTITEQEIEEVTDKLLASLVTLQDQLASEGLGPTT
jgi:adenosylmethionine-8-amino-7-oxononanoate aminotransferase